MPFGVPFREYAKTMFISFISMCAGSQCVHLYYQPKLFYDQPEAYDEQNQERRRALQAAQQAAVEQARKN